MKTTFTELEKQDENGFPKHMISNHDNCVVFMEHSRSGVVVCSGGVDTKGKRTDAWVMSNFRDFHGTIKCGRAAE